jgi:RecB family endonuclease NucS
MVKADGCVAVHSDGGAYKPLNWMTAPNVIEDNSDHWIVRNPKGEAMTRSFMTATMSLAKTQGLKKTASRNNCKNYLRLRLKQWNQDSR